MFRNIQISPKLNAARISVLVSALYRDGLHSTEIMTEMFQPEVQVTMPPMNKKRLLVCSVNSAMLKMPLMS